MNSLHLYMGNDQCTEMMLKLFPVSSRSAAKMAALKSPGNIAKLCAFH